MTETSVLDAQALDRLRAWGGERLAAQMVRLFLKNSGKRMDQIRLGVTRGDCAEAERGAHSLKSSAAYVGAEQLRTLAAHLEAAAIDGQQERFGTLLPQIEAAYAAVMSELESLDQSSPEDLSNEV
jgi:two-component system sensor histidine kinase/response regulator